MARPSKAYLQVVVENKSHRTKAELETRKKAEESLISGTKMVCRIRKKDDEMAYKQFKRIEKILENVNKNDALYEVVLNRYCTIYSECIDFEDKRESFHKSTRELEEEYAFKGSMDFSEYMKLKVQLQQQVLNLDKHIMRKRAMLLAIEKEMAMTLAAALRAIPKKPAEEDDINADLF